MTRTAIILKIKQLLVEELSLSLTPQQIANDMPLLGNLPELDSMSIVSIITALEETFDFVAEDDELTAEVFESVDSLVLFVMQKQASS